MAGTGKPTTLVANVMADTHRLDNLGSNELGNLAQNAPARTGAPSRISSPNSRWTLSSVTLRARNKVERTRWGPEERPIGDVAIWSASQCEMRRKNRWTDREGWEAGRSTSSMGRG